MLVIEGAAPAARAEAPDACGLARAVAELEAEGMDRKAAMKEVARQLGVPKRTVYQALLEVRDPE